MKRNTVILLLFGFLLISSHVLSVRADDDDDDDDEAEASDVVDVTAINWDDTVAKKTYSLVSFTAPWCGHCKSLKPEWARAATELKEINPDVLVGNVDATKETDLATKFEVKGYPTIKFFIDGEATEYDGGRTSEEIIGWVKKRTGPPAKTVDAPAEVQEALKGTAGFVLGYFDKLEGDAYDTFISAARAMFGAEVFETTSKDVAKLVKLTKPGTVAVARKYFEEWEYVSSDGHEAFKGDGEESDAAKYGAFFKQELAPVYLPYNQDAHSKLFDGPVQNYVFVFGTEKDIATLEKNVIKPTAKAHRGKAVITSIDVDDSAVSGILNYFIGSAKPEGIKVMGWHKEKGKKFAGPEKVDKKSFDAFLKDLEAGKAKVFLKSEAVPEKQEDDDGITTVVGTTFEKIVLGGDKDVMLEVHAPWCGHCKSFLPTYKKLAKRFKKVDTVVIAQLDGTANEHEALEVKGFPTVLFYPAGSKTPINYEGERSLKDLTKFIKKNAKKPFELPKKNKDGKEEEEAPKDEL